MLPAGNGFPTKSEAEYDPSGRHNGSITQDIFEDERGGGCCRVFGFARCSLIDAQRESPAIAAPLSQFGYGDVELLEGPLREQFDANHAFYLGWMKTRC